MKQKLWLTLPAVVGAGLWGVAMAIILTACSRAPSPPPPTGLVSPPNSLVDDPRILEAAHTIILVRVIDLNPESATMLVLKSWEGLSAGHVLHTPKGAVLCAGRVDDCDLYQFQPGDQGKEFLIMSRTEIIEPGETTAMPA